MSRPQASRPLAGRRVVVTRPAGGADPAARRLRALGASVLTAPAIAFEAAGPAATTALDARLGGLGDGDWVAFASATAVRAVAGRSALARAAAAGARIAAVGGATAAACRAAGLDVAVTAGDGTARGLAAAMIGAEPVAPARGALSRAARPPRAVLPGADIARAELADGLRAAGWTVEAVTTYRTVPRPPAPAVVRALADGVDAVVFASPSAVDALVGGLDAAARAGLARAAVVCIGPTTAAAVTAAGLPVAAVAAQRSAAALADAVVAAVVARVEGACP